MRLCVRKVHAGTKRHTPQARCGPNLRLPIIRMRLRPLADTAIGNRGMILVFVLFSNLGWLFQKAGRMLKVLAPGVLVLFGSSSIAMASSPPHSVIPWHLAGVLLVKHDKDEHGIKHWSRSEDEDEDRDEDEGRGRRSFTGSSRSYYPPGYYGPPPAHYAPYSPYGSRPVPSPWVNPDPSRGY